MPEISAEISLFTRLNALKEETDFEFVLELIDIYLNETPVQIKAISAALANSDAHALAQVAHKLKGSSMNIGAVRMGELCLKLEEMGRSGTPVPKGISSAELESEFGQIAKLMSKFRQKG